MLALGLACLISQAGCDGSGPSPEPEILASDTEPAWSPDGNRVAYVHWSSGAERDAYPTGLYVLDLRTNARTLVRAGLALSPDWNPDGTRLAFSIGNIVSSEPDGSGYKLLTQHGSAFFPAWSPDGKRLAFDTSHQDPRGASAIWLVNTDGAGHKDISTHGTGEWRDPDWAPDGHRIVHLRFLTGVSGEEIFSMDSTGGEALRLTTNEMNDRNPVWSPDGQWIAWTAFGRGRPEAIWLMGSDGSEQQELTPGGSSPSWSPGSDRLVFSTPSPDGSRLVLWTIHRDGSGRRQLTR